MFYANNIMQKFKCRNCTKVVDDVDDSTKLTICIPSGRLTP